MDLDPPDEWWWYVANDNRGPSRRSVRIRPIAYRFHWTRVRMRRQPQIPIAQVLHWLFETTHRYDDSLVFSRRHSVLSIIRCALRREFSGSPAAAGGDNGE
jgi:hypothetical protein